MTGIDEIGLMELSLASKRRGTCKSILSTAVLWVFCTLAWADAPLPQAPVAGAQPQAAKELQTLRSITGHFGGGAWNDEVDRWNGKKHRLMQSLSTQVIQGEYQAAQLMALMGPPDRVWSKSDMAYPQLLQHTEWQGPAQGELWAYYWRGPHDQLLFALKEGKVTATGWLLSWE